MTRVIEPSVHMRVVQFGLVHRLCVCSTAVINDGIIITCMNLNVEEELERPGDRFTCCLTNVSQGKAGISLMSSRLVSGGLSTVARHHRRQLRPQFRRKHPPTTFVSSQKDIIPLQVVTSNEYLSEN